MTAEEKKLKIELVKRFTNEFPEVGFRKATLANNGDDHAVLILDKQRIVRFPRTEKYKRSFKQELRILKTLRERKIPVPVYDLVSRKFDFGSYKFIDGTELREMLFASFSREVKEKLVSDIASCISEIHSLPTTLIDTSIGNGRWDSDEIWRYSERYEKERRAVIKKHVNIEMLHQIDRLFTGIKIMKPPQFCVVHADLTDDHILVSPDGALMGIIDFGDVTIGDPAFDFSHFWDYDKWVPEALYANYRLGKDDRLLDRSRWHRARSLADWLFHSCEINDLKHTRELARKLISILSKIPELG